MGRLVELHIPPRSDHLALVRLVVEGAVRLGGALPDGRVDDLRLAVSEACTNALDAQHGAGSEEPIVILVDLEDDEVAVTVTDHAGGFEVDAVKPAPAATDPSRLRHEHGLGIPLMRSLVDEVTFTATAGGTAVRLVARA